MVPPRASLQAPQPLSAADRFWSRVQISEGCWLWTGSLGRHGRGRLVVGTRAAGTYRELPAAQVSYILPCGPIPDGLEVCHNCPGGDNPACVRPEHLFLGTHAQNMADASKKLRLPHGETARDAKLTDLQVLEIRRRYAAGGILQRELAAIYNVTPGLISVVVTGKGWKHLRESITPPRRVGHDHPSAKLTVQQEALIRQLYAEGQWGPADLRRQFGVSNTLINRILGLRS